MINEWGNNSEVISVAISALTLCAAIYIGYKANAVAESQANQSRRDTIEKIYLSYFDAMIELVQEIEFPESARLKLINARSLASLHREKEIEFVLQKLIEDFQLGRFTLSEAQRISATNQDAGFEYRLKYINIHNDLVYSERPEKIKKIFQDRMEQLL